MKIHYKILIIVLSIVIVLGVSFVLISRNIAANNIKEQIKNNLLSVLQTRANYIELELSNYKELSKMIASENIFYQVFNKTSHMDRYIEEARQRIESIIKIHRELSNISVLNKEGMVIVSNAQNSGLNKNNKGSFLKGREGQYISDLHFSSFAQKYILSISTPIFTNGQYAGVLVVDFNANRIFGITTNYNGLGKTGEVYLVNKDGYIISPSRFIEDVILKQKIDLAFKQTDDYFLWDISTQEEIDFITDYRGVKTLRMYTKIPELRWYLFAEIDEQEAFAPIFNVTKKFMVLFGIFLLFAIFISLTISRIVTRSIRKLHAGTEEIIKGNLNYKVGTLSSDEVGELSRAFDEMTSNLKNSRQELEEVNNNLEIRVKERTSELAKDIRMRKKVEKMLREEKIFTSTLIDTAQAIVLVLDKEGNIILFNKFAEKITGYKLDEVKGKNWIDTFLPKKDKARITSIFYEAVDDKQTKGITNLIISKSGQKVEIEWYDKTLKDAKNRTIGLLSIGLDVTERNKLQRALKESEERLSFALDATNDGVWDWDLKLNKLYLSDQYHKMLDYQPGEIDTTSNKSFENLLHPDDRERVLKKVQGCIEGTIKEYRAEFRLKTKFGKWKWILSRGNVVLRDAEGKALRFLGTHVDISLRKKMEEALISSKEHFAHLFQNNPEAAVFTDENGIILDINIKFSELFGYTLEEVKGKNINSGIIHPPEKIEEGKMFDNRALENSYFTIETVRQKKNGSTFPVLVTGSSIIIKGKKQGMIGLFQDITDRKRLKEKLERLARIDSLTGAYNRRYGMELLERQIKLSKRHHSYLSLAFLDIDDFKLINDNFGHGEGDKTLIEVTHLFQVTLREIDIICRMGGDEFLLIFPDISIKKARLIKKRLIEGLIEINKLIKKDYQINFSIGLSEYDPKNPLQIDDLIRIADQEMYEEKKKKS